MNDDFNTIKNILLKLRNQYAAGCDNDICYKKLPITERDIVSDIRQSLLEFCNINGYDAHCEIRPAPNEEIEPEDMKRLPRIDVVILRDRNNKSWLEAAKKLQGKYKKGHIEARFSSIPLAFFHTAIEVKIQSKFSDAKDDIVMLSNITDKNPSCNCFFVLLNARGQVRDHQKIITFAKEKQVEIIEHTARI
ncbi:hypothetical protein ACFLTA_08560 [Bacteroidota bacterium]